MNITPNIYLEFRSQLVKAVSNDVLNKSAPRINHKELIEKYKYLIDNLNGFIIISNYTNGLYEYVSEGIRHHLGHNLDGFSNEQVTDFMYSIIYEKHGKFILTTLLPTVFKFFKENSTPATGTEYRYTCCVKVRNIYNNYLWYLVDTVIIQIDETGFPLRTLITCTNIDNFKKDEVVYYNILKKDEAGMYRVMLEGTENDNDEYNLTPREIEITNLVARGFTNKQIAHQLSISLNTVQTHRKSIIKKTGCSGTAELTNFAFSRGLI